MDTERQIALLRNGDRETIKSIFLEHKQGFQLFASRFTDNSEEISKIYQNAIIALVEDAIKGKLEVWEGDLKICLYEIGKYQLYKSSRVNNHKINWDEEELKVKHWESYEKESQQEEIQVLKRGFSTMGDKCREILSNFYYRSKTLNEICTLLEYESVAVLKTTMSNCIRSLTESIKR